MAGSITINRNDNIVQLLLNNPEKKNALTMEMYQAAADAIEAAESDSSVHVILFSGAAGNFTSGNDISSFPPPSDDGENPVARFISLVVKSSVPMVAAVEGIAAGIGATMLSYLDAVVADKNSKILYPFINLALPPEAGSTLIFPQKMGYTKAAQLLMRGKAISSDKAYELGIVSQLCEPGTASDNAMAIAKEFAAKPSAMMRQTKQLLKGDIKPVLERIKQEEDILTQAFTSPEHREIIATMMNKKR